MVKSVFNFFFFLFLCSGVKAQSDNIVRELNQILLNAITNDLARPTVHARNLFHLSAMTYDIYAVYYNKETYFLGKDIKGYDIDFQGAPNVSDTLEEMKKAISFASYRLLKFRFQNSPGVASTYSDLDDFMLSNGYDISITSSDYLNAGPAEFGNYVAEIIINYGLQDGSNEANNYANTFYEPVNPPLEMMESGNPETNDPNRWQAISVPNALDQANNPVLGVPPHLSPEWGRVNAFSLNDSLKSESTVDGDLYSVFCDPGAPPYIDTAIALGLNSFYKWNFCMVPIWQSHLDPADGIIWDISPASIGKLPQNYPEDLRDIDQWYDFYNGGHTFEQGYSINPKTGSPYESNLIPRADYARVLAEFWADGIDSETPPGHWFKIYHEITTHNDFEFKWMGEGETLSPFFYDILAHFVLGGMMHDAAITAWSIKGRYDYVRPASAIRYMAGKGQCSDPNDLSYHPAGLPVIPNYIELVYPGDPLAGVNDVNVGKMKLYTWRGPDFIPDPENDVGGVGWILAENWWPYQRPSFVTPPFAGYISGHSTFSTTAAEVLSIITGDPYFPGGMSEFEVEADEFLEFENGPTTSFKLQWATYRDAANQCSLSRIWGGIHPPIDDIPGRKIGLKIGPLGTHFADSIISIKKPYVIGVESSDSIIMLDDVGATFSLTIVFSELMETTIQPNISFPVDDPLQHTLQIISASWLNDTVYKVNYQIQNSEEELSEIVMSVSQAFSIQNVSMNSSNFKSLFVVDMIQPDLINVVSTYSVLNESVTDEGFYFDLFFSEKCNMTLIPIVDFSLTSANPLPLIVDMNNSFWLNDSTYHLAVDLIDYDQYISNVGFMVSNVFDQYGNALEDTPYYSVINIDTKAPDLVSVETNKSTYQTGDIGFQTIQMDLFFSKNMNTTIIPEISFINTVVENVLTLNPFTSQWLDTNHYRAVYNLNNTAVQVNDIGMEISQAKDTSANDLSNPFVFDVFNIDTERPQLIAIEPSSDVISDNNSGDDGFYIDFTYSESMDTGSLPFASLTDENGLIISSLQYNPFSSFWVNDSLIRCFFNVTDENSEIDIVSLTLDYAKDSVGNLQESFSDIVTIQLDTKNPNVVSLTSSSYQLNNSTPFWESAIVFDEPMDENLNPSFVFSDNQVNSLLSFNSINSLWLDESTYIINYEVLPFGASISSINVSVIDAKDKAGNESNESVFENHFSFSSEDLSTSSESFSDIVIYPNPVIAGNQIYVDFKNPFSSLGIELLDPTGRIITDDFIINSAEEVTINIPLLGSGQYFLRIITDSSVEYYKLIIK